MTYVRPDASEDYAQIIVDIINWWMMPEQIIMPWMDLQTLWIYLQRCIDNKEKQEVLSYLNMIMIQQWISQPTQAPQPWWQMNGIANSMGSQAMGNAIQDQRKQEQESSLLLQK